MAPQQLEIGQPHPRPHSSPSPVAGLHITALALDDPEQVFDTGTDVRLLAVTLF